LFVHYRDALTQDGSSASIQPWHEWDDIPSPDRERLVAAARLALIEIESSAMENDSRRYYSKPGEAEWGC
jgi:hypothetical protein